MTAIPRLVVAGTHSGVGKTTIATALMAAFTRRMVGLFPTRARIEPRLAALGYLEAVAPADALWLCAGEPLRGHEFRYSEIDAVPPEIARTLRVHFRGADRDEGYRIGSALAGYAHLHFGSRPRFAHWLVEACRQWRSTL